MKKIISILQGVFYAAYKIVTNIVFIGLTIYCVCGLTFSYYIVGIVKTWHDAVTVATNLILPAAIGSFVTVLIASFIRGYIESRKDKIT